MVFKNHSASYYVHGTSFSGNDPLIICSHPHIQNHAHFPVHVKYG